MEIRLIDLEPGNIGRVSRLKGGRGFQRRLRTRGIREGVPISILARQPGGPLVLKAGETKITMGRGIGKKILVQVG